MQDSGAEKLDVGVSEHRAYKPPSRDSNPEESVSKVCALDHQSCQLSCWSWLVYTQALTLPHSPGAQGIYELPSSDRHLKVCKGLPHCALSSQALVVAHTPGLMGQGGWGLGDETWTSELGAWLETAGYGIWQLIYYLMEKAMVPHSSTLAWKIPRTEKRGRLQSMGSLRVGHDWATSLSLFTFMHWRRKWQPTPVFLPGQSQAQRSLMGCRLWGRTDWTQLKRLSSSSSSSILPHRSISHTKSWNKGKRGTS